MSKITFTKMHGLGNDYVYVDCLKEDLPNPSKVAQFVADRHFGIGGDGLVLIKPSSRGDFRMQMFNADGSESEMCGNAIRCVAKYVYDWGHTDKEEIVIETLAGDLAIDVTVESGKVQSARVDMGAPRLKGSEIPVAIEKDQIKGESVLVEGEDLKFTAVSMGNPHAVFFTDEITDDQVLGLGPKLETHSLFPNRINVEFAKVLNRSEIQMRVWERGTGETLACGTGACATAVAAHINGLVDDKVTLHLLGGDLEIEITENTVYMTGPATLVFQGEIELPF